MTFTTLTFLIFFGIVFFGYYLIPQKFQWPWLLVASVVFYLFSTPVCILYLWGTVTITYLFSRWLDKIEGQKEAYLAANALDKEEKKRYKAKIAKQKKGVLTLGLVLLVGTLVVVKYTSFFLENLNKLMGVLGNETSFFANIIVPIGLSFYIFQSVGYLVDVYRGTYAAERNYLKFALYISYFPHIMQGPLDDYQKVSAALFAPHTFDRGQAVLGIQRAAWGFFKKLVVANQISMMINGILQNGGSGEAGITIFFVIVLYAIQLYADFSGYMEIAIGCSQMLGIPIAENFDTPYFSGSIAEYWRRWHITLGTWVKNYIFYPVLRSGWCMGLRRALKRHKYLSSTLPTAIALCIVWLVIGFWHGASWSYVFHGIYHGGFIVLATFMEPLYAAFYRRFPRVKENKVFGAFRVVRTFLIVVFGYYLFAPGQISLSVSLLQNTFSGLALSGFVSFIYNNFRELLIVFAGTLVMLFADIYHLKPGRPLIRERISALSTPARYALYIACLFIILFFGAYGPDVTNQFIYFRF